MLRHSRPHRQPDSRLHRRPHSRPRHRKVERRVPSGVRSGALVARSDARSGTEVAKRHNNRSSSTWPSTTVGSRAQSSWANFYGARNQLGKIVGPVRPRLDIGERLAALIAHDKTGIRLCAWHVFMAPALSFEVERQSHEMVRPRAA
jgi:hypothetical protein